MHMDPMLPPLAGLALVVLVLVLVFGRIGLPPIVAYIVAGVLIGPDVLDLIPEPDATRRLGEIGLVLLLFLLGMEMSLPRLVTNWRVSVLGTTGQILVSVALVLVVGAFLNWAPPQSVLLGFVVALSSSAVVVPLLREWGDLNTPVGDDVLGVLLVQDIAVVPMIVILGMMSGHPPSALTLTLQIVGAATLIFLVVMLERGLRFSIPFAAWASAHRDAQVFASFAMCFGLAYLTAKLGLSTAMGAFVGGILVAGARETEWVVESLEPFRILLMAFFFVSIGAILELDFLRDQLVVVLSLTVVVIVSNTAINALILRALGRRWPNCWYGGALLSQVGEFSFMLAALGLQIGIMSDYAYQSTVAVIAISLLISPVWSRVFKAYRLPSDATYVPS